MKKTLNKVVRYSIITFIVAILAVSVSVYVLKDKIIALVVAEINKKLNTQVSVDKIDITLLDKFPEAAVYFENILITGSAQQAAPLAKLKKIYLTFEVWQVLKGNYNIHAIYLEQGEVNICIDKNGIGNYLIFKPDSTHKTDQAVNFSLQKIYVTNVLCNYNHEPSGGLYSFMQHQTQANLQVQNHAYDIKLDGDLLVNKIKIGHDIYFKDKEIKLQTALQYNRENESLSLKQSGLKVGEANFMVKGMFDFNQETNIDLNIEGQNTNIQTLLSLLPGSITNHVKAYESEGDVYFKASIVGKLSTRKSPLVNVDFGCNKVSLFHPELKKRIENTSFKGSFTNGKNTSALTSQLQMTDLQGEIDGKRFEGKLLLKNFNDPYAEFHLSTETDIAALVAFYPIPAIDRATGQLHVDLDFEGKPADLKQKQTIRKVNASGEINITNLNFKLKDKGLVFKNLTGDFIFNKNDVAVSGFSGQIGQSDFEVNGFFKNLIPYLFFNNQALSLEATYKAQLLDLNELLQANEKQQSTKPKGKTLPQTSSNYEFAIAPNLALNLKCEIGKARFRRFAPKQVKGNIVLRNQVADFNQISMQLTGGKLSASGRLDARNNLDIEIGTKLDLEKMQVDSLFYVFENFDQAFLQQKNISGQVTATIDAVVGFNNKLEINPHKVFADIHALITNGQLINFEPLQALNRFVGKRDLSLLHFSELKNNILIDDRKIFIPEMEIRSNLLNISLNGSHSFGQQMDYKLKIPIKNFVKPDRDEAFGAVEDDGLGNGNIFLTLKGTPNNIKIAYDKQSVKAKIKQDLRKEKEEFKSLFRKEKQSQLEDKPAERPEAPKQEEKEFFDF